MYESADSRRAAASADLAPRPTGSLSQFVGPPKVMPQLRNVLPTQGRLFSSQQRPKTWQCQVSLAGDSELQCYNTFDSTSTGGRASSKVWPWTSEQDSHSKQWRSSQARQRLPARHESKQALIEPTRIPRPSSSTADAGSHQRGVLVSIAKRVRGPFAHIVDHDKKKGGLETTSHALWTLLRLERCSEIR